MIMPKYAELAVERQQQSAAMPGSPKSRGMRMRVPSPSAHLERLRDIRQAAQGADEDPIAAVKAARAGWIDTP